MLDPKNPYMQCVNLEFMELKILVELLDSLFCMVTSVCLTILRVMLIDLIFADDK